ncbi:3-hydroxypropionyl-coenzyme A dehydratase (3-hydroxypropionyl-CoA dehydratase) [Durusdinium trenchii]|uniref:3-hydroxypropionyl-coenzyme A dehydratase (3-hydroxypropionyl-CoA dehydratase) n=1 Tax=Durusdinium trenchii TaxID=1381693 RepID=A0ABP0LXF3_9DINO
MPQEIAKCVSLANADDRVHVIVLCGNGRAFCAGYDLKEYSEGSAVGEASPNQQMPWDPTVDFQFMWANTQDFMSLWHSYKPTICKVHGFAVAGGSDIALCCDVVIMAEDAKIGYPPARVWGCPTTAMWSFRLGPEKAKRMLDQRTEELAQRMSSIPRNQLIMQKMVINQSIEASMAATQRLATLFDGVTRHSPEGMWFKAHAEAHGFPSAIRLRDGGAPVAPQVARPTLPRARL